MNNQNKYGTWDNVVKEYDAIVVDNRDPQGKNRVKIRVQGHHPSNMPESELPWCLVQPKIGSNSGKGQKETLTIGQFCKVQPLDKAETEFKVIAGSNAFRNPDNKKGKPYSIIENSELQSVPIPDLASLDPEKLARTIFVSLMEKLTKRISEPVKPFFGTCGTIDPKASKTTGGCGGGKPGCGGPGVPKPGSDGNCKQKEFQSKIRCRKGKIDCKHYNTICGSKPTNYNMKFDWEKSVQTLSGDEVWVPCLESEIEIHPIFNKPGDPYSGIWEKNGNNCDGINAGCNKQRTVTQGLSICFAENIPCKATETINGKTVMGLQTNTMKLVATSKLPLNPNIPGNKQQPPITVPCEYYCGSNTCQAASKCPGAPEASDVVDPFEDINRLHEYTPNTPNTPNAPFTPTIDVYKTPGSVKTVEIDVKTMNLDSLQNLNDAGFTKTNIKQKISTIYNIYKQTNAGFKNIRQIQKVVYGSISVALGKKLADQADAYTKQMFGNLVNQANRILGEVQAAGTRAINQAVDGAMKIVDNSLGALGALDINLGGVEKIPMKILDQAVGGFGLGGVPGVFFHEVIRTDFLGNIENKFVTQYENGIAEVVDTSRGNKTWGIGTNDGARIEIANTGTALIKGANDVQIATESGTVSVTGANQITIVDGKATIHCDSFTVKAKTVDIAAPAIALNGDVEINGKLGVKKEIEAQKIIYSKTDVVVQKAVSKSVSLFGHTHKVTKAPGVTLPPVL